MTSRTAATIAATTSTYYGYDETGNLCWSGATSSAPQVSRVCGTTPGGDNGYTHDAAGDDTTTQTGATLSYNPLGQLVGAAGSTQGYLDQTNNLRTTATQGSPTGAINHFVNGLLGVTARYTGTGAPTFYTRDPKGKILDEHGASGYRYYVRDGLDNVVALLDPTGAIDAAYTYDPYGRTTATNENNDTTTAAGNPFRYRGGYQDTQEGDNLYHFGARYYDPTNAHFTQPDPKTGNINNPVTFLSYGYAGDDPTDVSDLNGQSIFGDIAGDIVGDVTAGVGGVISTGLAIDAINVIAEAGTGSDLALGIAALGGAGIPLALAGTVGYLVISNS